MINTTIYFIVRTWWAASAGWIAILVMQTWSVVTTRRGRLVIRAQGPTPHLVFFLFFKHDYLCMQLTTYVPTWHSMYTYFFSSTVIILTQEANCNAPLSLANWTTHVRSLVLEVPSSPTETNGALIFSRLLESCLLALQSPHDFSLCFGLTHTASRFTFR